MMMMAEERKQRKKKLTKRKIATLDEWMDGWMDTRSVTYLQVR